LYLVNYAVYFVETFGSRYMNNVTNVVKMT